MRYLIRRSAMNRWIVAPVKEFRGPKTIGIKKIVLRAIAVSMLALLVIIPATADKSKSAFQKGVEQEGLEHFQQAYEFYKQAFDITPKNPQYRAAYERMKFRAAAEHVHKGQQLREAGKLPEALVEFEQAVQIDPSNFMAAQEARRTKELIDQQANPDQQP